MTTTQGVTQQVAHSMTLKELFRFRGFSPPGDPFRGGAPSHGKVNVMRWQQAASPNREAVSPRNWTYFSQVPVLITIIRWYVNFTL